MSEYFYASISRALWPQVDANTERCKGDSDLKGAQTTTMTVSTNREVECGLPGRGGLAKLRNPEAVEIE
jgi:hypothetical protein